MALQFTKLFQPTELPATSTSIFVLSGPSTSILRNGRVRLTNTTVNPVAVTLYAVPSGGAASATNDFFPAVSIAAGSITDVDVPVLAIGDAIFGFAGAASSVNIQAMDGVIYS